jgi:hypothetical protein
MSSNAEIVKHHVESLVNGDVDEVMSDFAANAVILCGPQPIRGSEAIRAFFSGIPASFDGFELDASASESDHHYIAWHTAGGLAAPTRSASATARLSCRQPFYSISSTDLSAAHDVPSPPHFNQHEHLHMASENRALRGIRCVTDAARLDADANVASRRIEQRLSVNSSTPGPHRVHGAPGRLGLRRLGLSGWLDISVLRAPQATHRSQPGRHGSKRVRDSA